jgi:hypothetical protein
MSSQNRLDLVHISNPSIAKLIDNYFDVMWGQDMKLFDKVFHKDCALYSTQTGELNLRPYATYREAVVGRKSPKVLKDTKRRDAVLMFDQISPTLALVRVQLQMFGGKMQDYLNIVYLDGQWWVMAKMWERVGDAV